MIPPAASYQPAREELLFQELSEVRARLKEVERENSCLRKALAFKEAVIKAMEFLSGIRRCAAEKYVTLQQGKDRLAQQLHKTKKELKKLRSRPLHLTGQDLTVHIHGNCHGDINGRKIVQG